MISLAFLIITMENKKLVTSKTLYCTKKEEEGGRREEVGGRRRRVVLVLRGRLRSLPAWSRCEVGSGDLGSVSVRS